jgi:hypothetical protein
MAPNHSFNGLLGRGAERSFWLALGLVLVTACSEGREGAPPLEVERLTLVPPGRCELYAIECTNTSALLVDRFEVTHEEWQRVMVREGRSSAPREFEGGWEGGSSDWPATGMNLAEAREFAAIRGMRLPTVSEWMRIASGTRAQRWPWGSSAQTSAANTSDLGLYRPVPVGTFQNGRTSSGDHHDGAHDMLGNVWEWTEPPLPEGILPSSAMTDPVLRYEVWALGGSFNTQARTLHSLGATQRPEFFAQGISPDHRARDLGLRCIVDAEEYLWREAPGWEAEDLEARMRALGRTWGLPAVPILERLAAREGAPEALSWILAGARQ